MHLFLLIFLFHCYFHAIFVVNFSLTSVCAAQTCSHQSFDGSSYCVYFCRCTNVDVSRLVFIIVCSMIFYWIQDSSDFISLKLNFYKFWSSEYPLQVPRLDFIAVQDMPYRLYHDMIQKLNVGCNLYGNIENVYGLELGMLIPVWVIHFHV